MFYIYIYIWIRYIEFRHCATRYHLSFSSLLFLVLNKVRLFLLLLLLLLQLLLLLPPLLLLLLYSLLSGVLNILASPLGLHVHVDVIKSAQGPTTHHYVISVVGTTSTIDFTVGISGIIHFCLDMFHGNFWMLGIVSSAINTTTTSIPLSKGSNSATT